VLGLNVALSVLVVGIYFSTTVHLTRKNIFMWRYLVLLLFVLVGCVESAKPPVSVVNKPAGVAWFLEPKYLEEQEFLKRQEVLIQKRNELQHPWKNKVVNSGLETNITCVRSTQECPLYDDVCISNVRKCSPNNIRVMFDDILRFKSEWWEQTTDFEYPIDWFLSKTKELSDCCYTVNAEITNGVGDIVKSLDLFKYKELECRKSNDCLDKRSVEKNERQKETDKYNKEQQRLDLQYQQKIDVYNLKLDQIKKSCSVYVKTFEDKTVPSFEYFKSACYVLDNIKNQKQNIKDFWNDVVLEKSNPTGLYSVLHVYELGKQIQETQSLINGLNKQFLFYKSKYEKKLKRSFLYNSCSNGGDCKENGFCAEYSCEEDGFNCTVTGVNGLSMNSFYTNLYENCVNNINKPKPDTNKITISVESQSKQDDDFQSLVLRIKDLVK
jgi:hypothetical protein